MKTNISKRKNLSKLLRITALVALAGLVLIACLKQDSEHENPIPKELHGTWKGRISGNDYDTMLTFAEHSLTTKHGEQEPVTNGARCIEGKIEEVFGWNVWTTLCKGYKINGNECTFYGWMGFPMGNEVTMSKR